MYIRVYKYKYKYKQIVLYIHIPTVHAMADTNKKVISIEMKKKYRPYEKGQHAANHFIKSIWPEEVTAAPLTE